MYAEALVLLLRAVSFGSFPWAGSSGPAPNACGGLEPGEQISLNLGAVHTSGMCWDGPS